MLWEQVVGHQFKIQVLSSCTVHKLGTTEFGVYSV